MRITFIGLGEAASAIIAGWGQERARSISAWDRKLESPQAAPEIRQRAASLSIRCGGSLADALAGAELVFSTVTPDQAVAAARAAAAQLPAGCVWFDLNSCAPLAKRIAARVIGSAGGSYLDVAVMTPIFPDRNLSPLLVSGPEAEALASVLESLPMRPRVVGDEVGRASAIKMIRSVMVKGLEALTAECVLAAVAAGVEDEVIPSLREAHPRLDVARRAAYNFERSLRHGERRAAEMEEVATTLEELGLPAGMSRVTADWQRRIAACGVAAPADPEAVEVRQLAAAILARIRED